MFTSFPFVSTVVYGHQICFKYFLRLVGVFCFLNNENSVISTFFTVAEKIYQSYLMFQCFVKGLISKVLAAMLSPLLFTINILWKILFGYFSLFLCSDNFDLQSRF